MTISRDTFDPEKNYKRLDFHEDRQLLDSELNELQDLQDLERRNIADQVFTDGAILSGFDFTFVNRILNLNEGKVYVEGRVLTVPASSFDFTDPTLGDIFGATIFLELIISTITLSEDSSLQNPRTGEPTAERRKRDFSLVTQDTTGDPLPAGAIRRCVISLFPLDVQYSMVELYPTVVSKTRLKLGDLESVNPGDSPSDNDILYYDNGEWRSGPLLDDVEAVALAVGDQQDEEREKLGDRIFADGTVFEGFSVLEVSGPEENTITFASGIVYLEGRIETVPEGTIALDPSDDSGQVYLEMIVYEESRALTLQSSDTTGDPLPPDALRRVCLAVINFTRDVEGYHFEFIIPGKTLHSLADLASVKISEPTKGQILVYDDDPALWENCDMPPIPAALDDLNNVNIVSPQDGDSLIFNQGAMAWEPGTPPEIVALGDGSGDINCNLIQADQLIIDDLTLSDNKIESANDIHLNPNSSSNHVSVDQGDLRVPQGTVHAAAYNNASGTPIILNSLDLVNIVNATILGIVQAGKLSIPNTNDDEFFNLSVNSDPSDLAGISTRAIENFGYSGMIRVKINGSDCWMPYYTYTGGME